MAETVKTDDVGRLGLFVPLNYSGILQCRTEDFIYPSVAARFEKDRDVTAAFLREVLRFWDHPALEAVPQDKVNDVDPFWNNGFFSMADARFAFSVVAAKKPRTVIEIGGGHSTRFMRLAISALKLHTRIVSIDPEPRADIAGVADEHIARHLFDVDLDIFDRLGPGDVLFHDGSHLTFNGSDTVRHFLEILPRLKPGVLVHIHDICLPYEYTVSFDDRGYSEQYMLASALLFGGEWEILLPSLYLWTKGAIPEPGLSFWMRRA